MVTWPKPRPFQGRFVTARLGHAKVNLRTKFEVPIFTLTEISNALQNVENGLVWGGYGSPKLIGNATI